jgi:hypothetical protein
MKIATMLPRGVILAPNGQPAALEALRNQWYEGSRWSVARKFVFDPVQGPTKDLDRYTRMELIKHARNLHKNSPLARGLIERLVTLTVGGGFNPVFKSSDKAWNKKAKEFWRKRSRNVHLGSRATFIQYQRAVARARFLDGECFTIKTSDDSVTYESRVQGVEADRVTGDQKNASNPAEIYVDGFNLNSQGTVVSYNLRGVKTPYAAENVVHHGTPGRLGEYRHETVLAAAINTARDVQDILALEKDAVKDASSKQDVIKTASGVLDAETFRAARYTLTSDTPLFNIPLNNDVHDDYYRQRFGGQPVVLRKGDEYTPYEPKRPGAAWQGFMDFLAMTICLQTGWPPTVILPMPTGGTDIRRDLDVAQRVADPIQLDLACEFDDILLYLLEEETVDGVLRNPPDDWRNINWHFPQKINVDRQQATSDRDDVRAALMSREEYHARWSGDAEEVDNTVIEEAKRRRDGIKAAGFKSVEEFMLVLNLDPAMIKTTNSPDQKPGTPPAK